MQEDEWKYITSEQFSEHRFRGQDGVRLLCSYFELNLSYEHFEMVQSPVLVGFMEVETAQYCAYYSDGRVYTNESTVVCAQKGPHFSGGDVIGCGFDFNAGVVFYTRNGLLVGIFHRQRYRSSLRGQQLSWKPIIGFTGEKKFLINFGHQPFLYDLCQHEEFMRLYTTIQTRRWPALARPMTFPPEILSMILIFLSLQLLDLQRGDQYKDTIQCLHACRLSCRAWAALLRSAALWQVRLVSSATLSAFITTTLSSQSSQDLVRIAQVIEGDQVAGEVEWSYQCLVLPRLGSVDVLYLDQHQQSPRRAWAVRQRLPPRLSLNPWIPFSAFSNVTRLELRNHVSQSFTVFSRLLSTFRRLRQLSCIETCWEECPSQHLRKYLPSDCLENVDFMNKTFFPAQWQTTDFFINCSSRSRACTRPRVHISDGELVRQVVQLLIVWQNSSTRTFTWTSKYTGVEQMFTHKQSWTYEDVDDFAFSKSITFRLCPRIQANSGEQTEVHYLTELELTIQATTNQLDSDVSAQAPGWRTFKRAITWSIFDSMLKNSHLSSLTSVRVVYDLNEWDHDIAIWTSYGLLRRMPYCRHAKLLWVVSSSGQVVLDPARYSSVLSTPPVGWNDAEEYEPGLMEENEQDQSYAL
ncbi:hypothetical protein EIP86_010931 [Pleurotus ostreatoroseus]|nr:hypothetical protein EIP86_010931 [Pleurotus ostreatoroseus]